MTRRYDDPVEVRRRDEDPAEFLWRGRLYVVREVLSHWVETAPWWRGAAARSVLGLGADSSPGQPSSTLLASTVDDELEVWRVEATAGRERGTGVFDLALAWSSGSWTLVQALD